MLEGFVPWPEDFSQRYRQEGYWRDEKLGDLLQPWLKHHGQRTAVLTENSRWTYAELDERSNRLVAGLRKLGIGFGDRIVLQLPNIPEFISLMLALFRVGAAPVLALPAHRASEIVYFCNASGAKAYCVVDNYQGFDYRPMAAKIAGQTQLRNVLIVGNPGEFTALRDIELAGESGPSPSPDDVAFFLLSGGTTGLSKLIPRTHNDYSWQLRGTAEAVRFTEQSTYVAALPVAHNAALGCPGVLGALRAGGKVILAKSPSPDEVFPLIEKEMVTVTTLTPSLLALWLEAGRAGQVQLNRLLIEVGGARLDPDLARSVVRELRCRVMHWFGMAEGPLCHTDYDAGTEEIANTQGKPLCCADEICIVDDQDEKVRQGEVGNLLFRGPTTLRGYFRVPEYNANAFTADGFLRTGDLARIDAGNNLVAEGRRQDTINRGGEKISAAEVEDYLRTHPAVCNVAVVAVPDAAMGEKICAFLVCKQTAISRAEVKEFLRQRGVAEYKVPDRVEVVDFLPVTPLGKVDKKALRMDAASKPGGAQVQPIK